MEIIQKAELLGEKIKNSEEYQNYLKILSQLKENEYDYKVAKRFTEISDIVYKNEQAGVDVSPEIADEYEALVMRISGSELLKKYIKAESEYYNILQEVRNRLI